MINVYNLIHLYNILFLIFFNIIDVPYRIILVISYIFFYVLRTNITICQGRAIHVKKFLLVTLLLFLFTHSFLLNGYETIPNWDYYKYNKLLVDIFNSNLTPAVIIADEKFLLAYYYSIFLPTVVFGHFLQIFIEINVFDLQIIFVTLNTLIIAYMLVLINAEINNKPFNNIFLWLIFCFGGLDYALLILFHESWNTGILINDIQNGGDNWFFATLRLQDFLSYVFWLPAHTISSLVALYFIIMIRNEKVPLKIQTFILVPLVLFIFSTSIFVFASFIIFMAYFYMIKIKFNILNFFNYKTILILAIIIAFYSIDKNSVNIGRFLSKNIILIESKILAIFVSQEFILFCLIGLLTKQKSEYYLSILVLILFALFGSRDLLMSSGLLFFLYLLYLISIKYNSLNMKPIRKIIFVSIIFIALPQVFWNFLGAIDYQKKINDDMTQSEAIGLNDDLIQGVLKNYSRSTILHP